MRRSEKRNEEYGGTTTCRSPATENDRETKRSIESGNGERSIVYQYVGITGNVLFESVMDRRRKRGREIEFQPYSEKIVCTSCCSLCCLLQTI